jgi:hypothetical protein
MAELNTALLGDIKNQVKEIFMTHLIELLQKDIKEARAEKLIASYPGINAEVRTTLPTAAAAFYLNRRPQTMRSWASLEDGPILPIRINGRLAWPVAGIKQLLSGGH